MLLASVAFAAETPEAPSHTKRLMFTSAILFGATVLDARAIYYGAGRCIHEGEQFQTPGYVPTGPYDHRIPRDKYQNRFYARYVPVDLGIVALAFLMHKTHHHLIEMLLPIGAATAHTTSAAFNFSAGCY
jgi:hypothetical protein